MQPLITGYGDYFGQSHGLLVAQVEALMLITLKFWGVAVARRR